ncbi:MAG TPA: DUF4912 domain-containing protein [Verrucomicrobiota bacterium]|nr:DUF4912 domain-containing protein [Verrucomicrobiota bacterium]
MKKPRSATAAKPARRIVRRVTRPKRTPARRKTSTARAKPARTRSAKKPATTARRKSGAAGKVKRVLKRSVRKTRTRRARLPLASERLKATLAATPDLKLGAGMSEPSAAPRPRRGKSPAKLQLPAEAGPGVPPILLEEDGPSGPQPSGPGQKYVLGPATAGGQLGDEEGTLPEAYGTGQLVLAARDPRWLYAHWDLTAQQQRRYNALSADGHLVVRVHAGTVSKHPVTEVQVHPESRHWFINVGAADMRYVAELGYYRPRRRWVTIRTSAPVLTPADTVSADQTARFITIPAQARLTQLAVPARQGVPTDLPPLAPAREGPPVELVVLHPEPGDAMSSLAVGEIGAEAESVSSPGGAAEELAPGFWFNVNADIVIFGATEPDATVTIDGRPINLRADGTFSCRFSLPDGEHSVSVTALSAQGDLRQAELKFTRGTGYRGEVGAAAPDPALRPAAKQP